MADLEKLNNTIDELEKQSNELKEFNEVYSEISKLKQDITKNLEVLKDNNYSFNKISDEIQKRLENSKQQIEKLEEKLIGKIQELYQDNKNFQKELDSTLFSRLEKHNSDIQVEIRNEVSQARNSFENVLNANLKTIEIALNDGFISQNKKLRSIKVFLLIVALISLLTGVSIIMYIFS